LRSGSPRDSQRAQFQQALTLVVCVNDLDLAELPWVPHALGRNAEIHWVEVEDGKVEASAKVLGRRAAVVFEFDAGRDLVQVSALRPRQVGKTWVETPWGGTFSEYEVLDRIRLPGVAEVYWEIDAGRFV